MPANSAELVINLREQGTPTQGSASPRAPAGATSATSLDPMIRALSQWQQQQAHWMATVMSVSPPKAPVIHPAMAAARAATDRDQLAKQTHEQRMLIDPMYAAQEQTRQQREQLAAQQRRERERQAAADDAHQDRMARDPMYAARQQMQEERATTARQQAIHQERMRIDPQYRAQAAAQGRGAGLSAAANIIGATGVPGSGAASSLLAGAAGGGIVSAITGAISVLVSAISWAINKAAERIKAEYGRQAAIAGMDPMAAARAHIDTTKANMVFFPEMRTMWMGAALDMVQQTRSNAERLARFSPELSLQLAQNNIARLVRDIERAQTLGPDVMRGVNRSFNFEQKMNDFLDRNLPRAMDLLERLLDDFEDSLRSREQFEEWARNALGGEGGAGVAGSMMALARTSRESGTIFSNILSLIRQYLAGDAAFGSPNNFSNQLNRMTPTIDRDAESLRAELRGAQSEMPPVQQVP